MQITTFKRLAGLESYNLIFPMTTDDYASASIKILNGTLLFPSAQITANETPYDMHTLIQKNFCLAEKECKLMNEYARTIDALSEISNISKHFILDYSDKLDDMNSTLFDYFESYNRGYKFFYRFISSTNIESHTGYVDEETTNFRFGDLQSINALDANVNVSYMLMDGSSNEYTTSSNIEIYKDSTLSYIDVSIEIDTDESGYGLALRSETSFTGELGYKITANDRQRGFNFYPLSGDQRLTIRLYGTKDGKKYKYSYYISVIPFMKQSTTSTITTNRFDLTSSKSNAMLFSNLDPRYTTTQMNKYFANSDPISTMITTSMGEFKLLTKDDSEEINVFIDGHASEYVIIAMGNGQYFYTIDGEKAQEITGTDTVSKVYYGANCARDTKRTVDYKQTYTMNGTLPFLLGELFKLEDDGTYSHNLYVDITVSNLERVEIYDVETNKRVYQYSIPLALNTINVSMLYNQRNLGWYKLVDDETYLDVPINFCYVQEDTINNCTYIVVHEDQIVEGMRFRTSFSQMLDSGFFFNYMNISSLSTVNLISVFDSDFSRSALQIIANADGTSEMGLTDKIDSVEDFVAELGGDDKRIYLNVDASISYSNEHTIYNLTIMSEVDQQINLPKNTLYQNARGYTTTYYGEVVTSIYCTADVAEPLILSGTRSYCEHIINSINALNSDMFVYSGIDLGFTLESIDETTFNKQGLTVTLPYELIADVMPGGNLAYAFKYDGSSELAPIVLKTTKDLNESDVTYKLIINSEYLGYPLNSIEVMMS